jgi:hypothetical protein
MPRNGSDRASEDARVSRTPHHYRITPHHATSRPHHHTPEYGFMCMTTSEHRPDCGHGSTWDRGCQAAHPLWLTSMVACPPATLAHKATRAQDPPPSPRQHAADSTCAVACSQLACSRTQLPHPLCDEALDGRPASSGLSARAWDMASPRPCRPGVASTMLPRRRRGVHTLLLSCHSPPPRLRLHSRCHFRCHFRCRRQ